MAKNKFNLIIPSDESSVDLKSVISHYKNLDEKQTNKNLVKFRDSYLNWNSFRSKIREAISNSHRFEHTLCK